MKTPFAADGAAVRSLSGRVATIPSRKPMEHRRPSTDVPLWDADYPAQIRSPVARTWKTSAQAEWLNGLCPVLEPEFPLIDDVDDLPLDAIRQQFEFGFRRLTDDIGNLEFAAQHALTNRERAVWMTVKRKTLSFGKLAEKLPRRKFLEGEDYVGPRGLPALPPCGVDNRKLDDTISDLIAIGWLARFASDPYMGNISHVYLPFPTNWLIDRFFDHVSYAAGRGAFGRSKYETNLGRRVADAYREETLRRCASYLVSPPDYAALAPVQLHSEAVRHRKARKACRLVSGRASDVPS